MERLHRVSCHYARARGLRRSRARVGYGWFIRTSEAGHLLQHHAGAGAGFRASHYRLPKERLAVIIFNNVDERENPWILPLVDRIADATSGAAK